LKDRILGVLNLSDPKHGTVFEENDLKLLVTFASQAAVAIDDAENFARLSQKLTEFATLYELATKITTIDNAADMTDLILSSLKRIMEVDFTIWFVWNERSKTLELRYWVGYGAQEAGSLSGINLKLSEKDVFQSQVRAKAVGSMISDIPSLKEFTNSLTVVPIITSGSLHGLFCLGSSKEAAFSENDEYIASIVASQATSIYEQQRAVLNATRLVTMGKMMSEISHDLKKPLTNIRGSLQVMRERWPEITQSDEFFHTAEEELGRLNELVKELVDFSSPTKYQSEDKRLEDLIERVIRLVENDLKKHNVEIVKQLESGLPPVPVIENKIVELLLNLIINAIDAMPEGGTLTFAGRALEPVDDKGLRVELRISDTGVGIPPEQIDRIFDRYFTTKDTGTGLGLAICERIVMAHNGTITLESEQGKGTTFVIELPVV
jgi:signal transduction histidine kinase